SGTVVDITIEERSSDEVLYVGGRRTAPEGARVWNPAFDVTPAHLIRGIITERGIIEPKEEEIVKIM
ncbi:MAG: S-methyl-5-thioribose-1-phosphate isomerase, partial [Candidatus Bathyarchaeia archaeon]